MLGFYTSFGVSFGDKRHTRVPSQWSLIFLLSFSIVIYLSFLIKFSFIWNIIPLNLSHYILVICESSERVGFKIFLFLFCYGFQFLSREDGYRCRDMTICQILKDREPGVGDLTHFLIKYVYIYMCISMIKHTTSGKQQTSNKQYNLWLHKQ